jgi:copper(I)-binding protein
MKLLALFGAVGLAAGVAAAHDYRFHSLKIDHPFARATPPGARSGGVFLTIENTGTAADRLLSVSSPMAGVAELHEMRIDGGVMRMRAIPAMEVKPGDRLELKPGGDHAMLTELKQPLRVGDRFPLVLAFEKAGSVEVSVWVENMAAGAAPMHEHPKR